MRILIVAYFCISLLGIKELYLFNDFMHVGNILQRQPFRPNGLKNCNVILTQLFYSVMKISYLV